MFEWAVQREKQMLYPVEEEEQSGLEMGALCLVEAEERMEQLNYGGRRTRKSPDELL